MTYYIVPGTHMMFRSLPALRAWALDHVDLSEGCEVSKITSDRQGVRPCGEMDVNPFGSVIWRAAPCDENAEYTHYVNEDGSLSRISSDHRDDNYP